MKFRLLLTALLSLIAATVAFEWLQKRKNKQISEEIVSSLQEVADVSLESFTDLVSYAPDSTLTELHQEWQEKIAEGADGSTLVIGRILEQEYNKRFAAPPEATHQG